LSNTLSALGRRGVGGVFTPHPVEIKLTPKKSAVTANAGFVIMVLSAPFQLTLFPSETLNTFEMFIF
jgi:hypothetical protein